MTTSHVKDSSIHSLVHRKVVLTVHPDGAEDQTTGFVVVRVIAHEGDVISVLLDGNVVFDVHQKYAHVLCDDEAEPEIFRGLTRLDRNTDYD